MWRATNVHNSGALNKEDVEFIDASLWEEAETEGDDAIKKLIDGALAKSTVTAVLIGANTFSRKWVRYEINESIRRRKGLFGVHIYRIKDQERQRVHAGDESTSRWLPRLPLEQGQGSGKHGQVGGLCLRRGELTNRASA